VKLAIRCKATVGADAYAVHRLPADAPCRGTCRDIPAHFHGALFHEPAICGLKPLADARGLASRLRMAPPPTKQVPKYSARYKKEQRPRLSQSSLSHKTDKKCTSGAQDHNQTHPTNNRPRTNGVFPRKPLECTIPIEKHSAYRKTQDQLPWLSGSRCVLVLDDLPSFLVRHCQMHRSVWLKLYSRSLVNAPGR
jgi:hypothetical protein